nr:ATP-binding protein [Edaphobacter aggregans]
MLSQRYERGSTLITSNLPFQEWTEVLGSERLTGALLDRLTPSCAHPGDERRQLPTQAEPPQTDTILRTLNSTPPNAPRGRRAASATLQRPFSPVNLTTTQLPPTGLLLLRLSGLVLLRP